MTTSVIFDIGNVLIRWDPHRALAGLYDTAEALDAALDRVGFGDWNKEQDRGRSWAAGIAAMTTEEGRKIAETYAAHLGPAHELPIEGTIEILDELHANGVPLFALTNANPDTVEAVKAMHPFMAKFKDVCISGVEGAIKPDAQIFEILFQRNGLSVADCVFIDDSATNVAGAEAIGLPALHFTDPAQLRADLRTRGIL